MNIFVFRVFAQGLFNLCAIYYLYFNHLSMIMLVWIFELKIAKLSYNNNAVTRVFL